MNLGLLNEALAGGRRAPCSTPIFLFLFLTLCSASSSFVLLLELFAQYHGKTGWWFDSGGKKWEKVSATVGLCYQMDLISSVVYHVATHTWTLRLVEVESRAAEILLTLEMIPGATLPRQKSCCQELEGVLVSSPFFLPPKTNYTAFIGDVYDSREQSFGEELILTEAHHVVCETLLAKGRELRMC